MASLYSRSPVMVVEDWSEVTEESLHGYRVATTSKDVMFVDYWLDRIDTVVEEWRKTQKTAQIK